MATIKRGSKVKKGLKFFNYGDAGTWKSTFALDFLKMKGEDGKPLRVLYIDCETGSVDNYLEDLEDEGINLDNLLLVYTTTYSEVEEFANKAMKEEEIFIDGEMVLDADGNPFKADVIVVDGISVIADNVKFAAINVSEKRAKLKAKAQEKNAAEQLVAESTAGLEFKDHDKIKMKGKQLMRSLVTNTDKYVVVTSREKMKRKMANVDGKMQLVDQGITHMSFPESEYEFYTVLRHFEDEEDGTIKAQVVRKDRTKVFAQNEIIPDPSPLYWQSVIDGNKNKQSNVLNENYEDSIVKDENVVANGFNKKQLEEDEEKVDLVTAEDYQKEIQSQMGKLDSIKKKALLPKVKKAKLPLDFNAINDIEQLKQFLELVKG